MGTVEIVEDSPGQKQVAVTKDVLMDWNYLTYFVATISSVAAGAYVMFLWAIRQERKKVNQDSMLGKD